MSELNNWGVSYSSIVFFEQALNSHRRVASFKRTDDIFFIIERVDGLSTVKALLVDVYTLGSADVFRARQEFPKMDCIVTCADWNHYAPEAKQYGLEHQLGIFNISEFLGALWSKEPYRYVKKNRKRNSGFRRKSA